MNAVQINKINFQQFVSDNKGKLITFLHNDNKVSKVVVDVCSEYFTAKANESDAKIDCFYYFSECKTIVSYETLKNVLRTYKNVVLVYSKNTIPTSITRCDEEYAYGICPLIGSETKNDLNNIKSVFTIANDKWLLVYGDDEVSHQTNVDKDVSSDLYHLLKNNKTVDIHTKTRVLKGFELTNISGGILIGHSQGIPTGILINSVIGVTVGGVYYEFKNGKKYTKVSDKEPSQVELSDNLTPYIKAQNNTLKSCEKVINTINNLNKTLDKVFSSEDEINQVGFYKSYRLSPFLREFLGLKEDVKYVRNDITKKVVDYCKQHVNPNDNTKIIPDEKIYCLIGGEFGKQITFFDLQRRLDKHFLKEEPETQPQEVKLSAEERFNNFKRVYPEILKLDSFLKAIVQETQFSEYKKTLLNTYESEFTPNLWSNFCSYWESIKGAIVKRMPNIRYDPTIQALVKRFSVITHEIDPSNYNTKFVGKIDRIMSPQGNKIYEKLVNPQPQALPQQSQGSVNIEYRGKPKTVEVVNEYTHTNGKNYVLVKDLTDNGKTKTLFKEYIKYL